MNVVPIRPPEPIANLEAELMLIGAVMYQDDLLAKVPEIRPEHFSDPFHGRIWDEVCVTIRKGGYGGDVVGLAERVGGGNETAQLLADLVDRASPRAVRAMADTVLNAARLRRLLQATEEIRSQVQAGVDAFPLIAEAERSFSRMVQEAAPSSNNLIDAKASALETIAELDHEAEHGRSKGTMTGLRCFDRRLRGLRPGWLVVVAGRPSMGKTALARAAAFGASRRTKGQVVFFALEMARRELDERTLSQLSYENGDGIAYKDMHGDTLTGLERRRLRDLAHEIPDNFIIDDSPILSVEYVRRRVLALKQRGPVAAVFIDYLQIMDRPDSKGRNEASVIGEMTKGLKQLAREAETCVVVLSQINRGVESRDDKRPQLSDLRESGAIEQDANAVLFPYREVYYRRRQEPTDHSKHAAWETECALIDRDMDVIAAKVRQGAVGTDKQVYYAEFDAIEDRTEDQR